MADLWRFLVAMLSRFLFIFTQVTKAQPTRIVKQCDRNRKYIKCLVGYDFSQTLLIIFNLTFQYYIYFYVVQKHFNKSIPTNIPEKLFFQSLPALIWNYVIIIHHQ